jgi:hypothetical protein
MAPSSNDKGKKPMEEDHQDLKLKEEQVAGGSRARDPTFVGSMNAGRAFSHNMQGPTLPILDLNFMSVIKEVLLVTDELCAQYRVLERVSGEGDSDTSRRESQAPQDIGNFTWSKDDCTTTAKGVIRHWYWHPLGLFQAWGSAADEG